MNRNHSIKLLILIFIGFLFIQNANAQSEVDSLFNEAQIEANKKNYLGQILIFNSIDSIVNLTGNRLQKIELGIRHSDMQRARRKFKDGLSDLDKVDKLITLNEVAFIIQSKSQRATIYHELGIFDSCRILSKEVIEIIDSDTNYLSFLGNIYVILGANYSEASSDSAIKFFEKSKDIYEKLGDEVKAAQVYINLSNWYKRQGDFDNTEKYALAAIKIGNKTHTLGFVLVGNRNLVKVYIARNNAEALHKVLQQLDSLEKIAHSDLIKLERYELQKELEESKEKAKEEISELEQTVSNRGYWIAFALFIIVLLLAFVAVALYLRNVEKNQSMLKLAESIENQDKILSIISHDLRSPFAHLLTFLSFSDEGLSKEDKEQINSELKQNTQNGLLMLDNLLYWANNQANKGMHINMKLVNLKLSSEELLTQLRDLAKAKDISILNNWGAINFSTDETLLHIVLRNLISNAIKFSPTNSEIKLESKEQNGKLELYIIDNGMGMSPEVLAKLNSEKGQIIPESGSTGEKGAGLGLKLCFEFVQKINGKLKFVINENKGVTARLILPLK